MEISKDAKFRENYKRFLEGEYSTAPERISTESLARLFFEIGFSNGVMI